MNEEFTGTAISTEKSNLGFYLPESGIKHILRHGFSYEKGIHRLVSAERDASTTYNPIRIAIERPYEVISKIYTKSIVERLRKRIIREPEIMVRIDVFKYLPSFGFTEHEIESIRDEINEAFTEMAREKTGFDLDEESKTFLRNELVLAFLALAGKKYG